MKAESTGRYGSRAVAWFKWRGTGVPPRTLSVARPRCSGALLIQTPALAACVWRVLTAVSTVANMTTAKSPPDPFDPAPRTPSFVSDESDSTPTHPSMKRNASSATGVIEVGVRGPRRKSCLSFLP